MSASTETKSFYVRNQATIERVGVYVVAIVVVNLALNVIAAACRTA